MASNWTLPQMKIKQASHCNVGQWENKTLFTIRYMGDFSGVHTLQNVGGLWVPIRWVWLSIGH